MSIQEFIAASTIVLVAEGLFVFVVGYWIKKQIRPTLKELYLAARGETQAFINIALLVGYTREELHKFWKGK